MFLLFLFIAANGSYAGAFFFWTGFVGSPFVGVIASMMTRRQSRPLAIFGAVTTATIMLPLLAHGVFVLMLNHGY